MSDKAKSIIAAAWIAVAAGAFISGSLVRDRVDLASPASGPKLENLVASRDNSIGGRPQNDIPAGDFFYELTEKLKQEYVEPIGDEQKLASGAVRGMIGFLGDPESIFMDKDEFRSYLNERQGKFEGIGADLEVLAVTPGNKPVADDSSLGEHRELLQSPSEDHEIVRDRALLPAAKPKATSAIPRLTVVSVVPGGPADRAGVKPGDVVYSVDDHWVINADLAIRFNQAQIDFKAHKISWKQLNALREEVRDKYDRMMLPLRARDRLQLGTIGTVKVVWERSGEQRTTSIVRASSSMPGFVVKGDTILLPFTSGAPDLLRKAIVGKGDIKIDLRENTLGDFGVMRECIAAVAPSGNYGYETNARNGKPTPLQVSQGNPNPPRLTLITDRSTRGPAAIFALALSSRGIAKLSGDEAGGAREVYDVVQLPDGSGYTLVTARYHPRLDVKPAAVPVKAVAKLNPARRRMSGTIGGM